MSKKSKLLEMWMNDSNIGPEPGQAAVRVLVNGFGILSGIVQRGGFGLYKLTTGLPTQNGVMPMELYLDESDIGPIALVDIEEVVKNTPADAGSGLIIPSA